MGFFDTIYDMISNAVDQSGPKPKDIPSILLLAGAKQRPGLSPTKIASKIISRQGEAGAPVGNLPSGSDNIAEKMERIRVEEIINALLYDARIDVVVDRGIIVQATGANTGGPVTCIGQTQFPGAGKGIIR